MGAKRMSELPTSLEARKCDVAEPEKKTTELRAKCQDYLEQWRKRRFDSTATMIALTEFTGHPDRPSLDALFPQHLSSPSTTTDL